MVSFIDYPATIDTNKKNKAIPIIINAKIAVKHPCVQFFLKIFTMEKIDNHINGLKDIKSLTYLFRFKSNNCIRKIKKK